MITRRDKLLKNPWEQRRYENHLKKISSAVPVIDNKAPISRQHVSVKLKKRQMEIERMRQIENDNLILLRRINFVMNTNRVDNWNIPPQQTKYLSRVPLQYNSSRPSSHSGSSSTSTKYDHLHLKGSHTHESIQDGVDLNQNSLHLRKAKCLACSPHISIPQPDDSVRIPWEEPKMYSKVMKPMRERSKSLPLIKTRNEDINKLHDVAMSKKCYSSNSRFSRNSRNLGSVRNNISNPKNERFPNDLQARNLNKQVSLDDDQAGKLQRLVISSGSLKLCVKFPSDSHILIKNGSTEKTVFGNQYLH